MRVARLQPSCALVYSTRWLSSTQTWKRHTKPTESSSFPLEEQRNDIRSLFCCVDERFTGEWNVPYTYVIKHAKQMLDTYWSDEDERRIGLKALLGPGPDDYAAIVRTMALCEVQRQTEQSYTRG